MDHIELDRKLRSNEISPGALNGVCPGQEVGVESDEARVASLSLLPAVNILGENVKEWIAIVVDVGKFLHSHP